MTGRKFAAITGDILVRKGAALPAARPQHARSAPVWTEPAPPAQPKTQTAARHRIALRLTDDQFRRLGIAAARMHQTAQDFLIGALDARIAALAANELAGCRCLRMEESCGEADMARMCRGNGSGNRVGD